MLDRLATARRGPEPGRRYLIGASSFGEQQVGDYTVSIINDGTLTPL